MATPAEQRQEFAEWKVLRGVTSSVDEPDWSLVLLPSQVGRLRLYEEKYASLVREGRLLKDDDDFVCDLDQNPGANRGRWFDSTSLSMSCMIRHGFLWSFKHRRPLLACEQVRVHAWPWTSAEKARVGAVCDFGNLLTSQRLMCRDLTAMVGDSWSLRTQGLFLMWLLASCSSSKFSITSPLSTSMPTHSETEAEDDTTGSVPAHSSPVSTRARATDACLMAGSPTLTTAQLPVLVFSVDPDPQN